ncbi:hypothetical protein ADUPG1_008116 [Aduncisulcus paluster]|uniref:Uncharacterized protein n=1 Tax=Aduncisulcus paluster TaxID=2918883 RepID=A0ABQ5KQT1_9EUKA|nr:hypothetical protein ADUPG1_008116 [Aduncisulcus paluster]
MKVDKDKAEGELASWHSLEHFREKFLNGDCSVDFRSLFFPFEEPRTLGSILLCTVGGEDQFKELDFVFYTVDGAEVKKKYKFYRIEEDEYEWFTIPVDIDNVIDCDLILRSTWDGSAEYSTLCDIRFVIDEQKEQEDEIDEMIAMSEDEQRRGSLPPAEMGQITHTIQIVLAEMEKQREEFEQKLEEQKQFFIQQMQVQEDRFEVELQKMRDQFALQGQK